MEGFEISSLCLASIYFCVAAVAYSWIMKRFWRHLRFTTKMLLTLQMANVTVLIPVIIYQTMLVHNVNGRGYSIYFAFLPFNVLSDTQVAITSFLLYNVKIIWIKFNADSYKDYRSKVKKERLMLIIMNCLVWMAYLAEKIFEISIILGITNRILAYRLITALYRLVRILFEFYLTINFTPMIPRMLVVKLTSHYNMNHNRFPFRESLLCTAAVFALVNEIVEAYLWDFAIFIKSIRLVRDPWGNDESP